MIDAHPRLLPHPTIPTGPRTLVVGSRHYAVPQNITTVSTAGGSVAYLLTSTGSFHVLTAGGELAISDRLRGILKGQYQGGHGMPANPLE